MTNNPLLLRSHMDFIWDSCKRDATGAERPIKEQLLKLSAYVGWLEANLLANVTDAQAESICSNVKIHSIVHDDPEEESDIDEGGFY